MSLYFFDVLENGLLYGDDEGSRHADMPSVHRTAIDGIRSILSSSVREGILSLRGEVRIRDEQGGAVMVVPFSEAVTQSSELGA